MEKCKPSELPIYGEPKQTEYVLVPPESTPFSRGVTSFRKSLWAFLDNFKDTSETVQDKLGLARAHSGDLLRYIQEDAGIVPKAIIITVAGLGGVVAGYKGRYVRKGVFAGIGMTAAASICYPHQAVDITQLGWARVKQSVVGATSSGKPKPTAVIQGVTIEEQKDPAPPKEETNEPAKDFGQSKPEDKDMYTTRGS